MGCDIHLHIETKIYGQWENYGLVKIKRWYMLFAVMADVRNCDVGIEPIAYPKGLPDDISKVVRVHAEWWEEDGHHWSWLDLKEIEKLSKWLRKEGKDLEHDILQNYLFSNSFEGFLYEKKSYPKCLEDVRFVFWFDN